MAHERLSRRELIGIAAAGAASIAASPGTAAQMDHAPGADQRGATSQLPAGKIPVAIMLDDASTMMDFAGPWEVFQDVAMGGGSGYFLYTVAPQMRQYNTSGTMLMDGSGHGMKGLVFTPDFTFETAPQPQIVVMGAQMNFSGKEKIAWLQKVAPLAEVVLSVCTGNFIAGHAGLLDGLQATTHHRFYDQFEKEFPKVRLVREERVVDNGKFVSGGGITAGIDAALHVVRRHFDDKVVSETIKYMEYRAA
jgi:transcriptional regulator GlxA family with amidase domain